MKRRPELTVAEFREYWNSQEFGDLVNRMEDMVGPVSMIKNLTFNIELNTELMQERGGEEPYDGILELWFESASDLQKLSADEGEALRAEMGAFQEKFVDFSTSMRFFTEWSPVSGLN
jgi:hypothetical protein